MGVSMFNPKLYLWAPTLDRFSISPLPFNGAQKSCAPENIFFTPGVKYLKEI